MQELPPLPAGIRLLSDPEGERLTKLYPRSDLPSPEHCITCGGKGQFQWWAKIDGELAVDDWKCNCVDQWIAHRYFLHSGIGIAYQRFSWADVKVEPVVAKAITGDYLQYMEDYIANGIGLILHGNNGTGKTLLSTLLLKSLLGWGIDGYFTTFEGLMSVFSSTWRDTDEKQWFHKRIKNAGVLVVDDVGKEGYKGQDLPITVFDEVMRHRVSSAKPTFITTNLTLSDIELKYGSSAMGLLGECSIHHEFVGENFRMRRNNDLVSGSQQGLRRPIFT